jgi:hypothetical protein
VADLTLNLGPCLYILKKGVEKGELRLRILGKQWQKRYCLLVSYMDPALDATHAHVVDTLLNAV